MALAILANAWVSARRGTILALIVDHGLRAGSAAEAMLVFERLARLGIPARILTLREVGRGADAARRARYAALAAACVEAGMVHLLVGHHAADQAETLQLRVLAGSGADGFAGMPPMRETHEVRLLRPLLRWNPAALRRVLTTHTVEWVEDPSNANPRAQRGRLRRLAAGSGITELGQAAASAGRHRAQKEQRIAEWLAQHAMIFPTGFAQLDTAPIPAVALAALIQMISGAEYPPPAAQISRLATHCSPATVAGVMIMPAGRLGRGWLLVREDAAIGLSVPAAPSAVWDRRFRLDTATALPPGRWRITKLGRDAVRFRRYSDLPFMILRTLPAIRDILAEDTAQESLVAVPHIGYATVSAAEAMRLQFCPPRPASCAPWFDTALV
jgi:tRNA(Ile)-lysidine synthase